MKYSLSVKWQNVLVSRLVVGRLAKGTSLAAKLTAGEYSVESDGESVRFIFDVDESKTNEISIVVDSHQRAMYAGGELKSFGKSNPIPWEMP